MMHHRTYAHRQTTYTQGEIVRAPSIGFLPPVPAVMREPGTNYLTILTADGQAVIDAGSFY